MGADAALVTYFADNAIPGDNIVHLMPVGEFWIQRAGQWFNRGYSGTLLK